jgi:hypothetical protein
VLKDFGTQEEFLFNNYPDLLTSILFTERFVDLEAFILVGVQWFSDSKEFKKL